MRRGARQGCCAAIRSHGYEESIVSVEHLARNDLEPFASYTTSINASSPWKRMLSFPNFIPLADLKYRDEVGD
jgi:hypothetical protein